MDVVFIFYYATWYVCAHFTVNKQTNTTEICDNVYIIITTMKIKMAWNWFYVSQHKIDNIHHRLNISNTNCNQAPADEKKIRMENTNKTNIGLLKVQVGLFFSKYFLDTNLQCHNFNKYNNIT